MPISLSSCKSQLATLRGKAPRSWNGEANAPFGPDLGCPVGHSPYYSLESPHLSSIIHLSAAGPLQESAFVLKDMVMSWRHQGRSPYIVSPKTVDT